MEIVKKNMFKLYEVLQPDFTFEDDRGLLVQLVHRGYEQINVLRTRRGVTRGGHYHRNSCEAFYIVSGSVKLTFRLGQTEKEDSFSKGEFFLIYPNVIHSMYFPEDCVLVAMYDRAVEAADGTKDIFPG